MAQLNAGYKNMDGDTLRSGFTAVKENSGTPLGRDGEISAMLEQDMTVREAVTLMNRNWNLPADDDIEHEVGHTILALATLYPETPEGMPYQGDFQAENYVFKIEDFFRRFMEENHMQPHLDKEEFMYDVRDEYRDSAHTGNRNRTLLWALNRVRGDDPQDIRTAKGYNDQELALIAQNAGIIIEDKGIDGWTIGVPGIENEFFFMADDICYLPDEMEGVEDFKRFTEPSMEELSAVYDRIEPALRLIGEKIAHAQQTCPADTPILEAMHDAIANTRISELVDAMHSPRALALSTEAGVDQRGYHA